MAAARGAVAVLGAEGIDIASAVSGVAGDGRGSALAVVETGSGVLAAPANHAVIVEGAGHHGINIITALKQIISLVKRLYS